MRRLITLYSRYPGRITAVFAALVIILAVATVMASRLARPERLYQPVPAEGITLPTDQRIAGEAGFDRDSYHLGEIIHHYLIVRYRADEVTPDLDSLRRRLSFFPFEQINQREIQSSVGDGVTEYRLDFELQGVRPEPQKTYTIEPYVLYYTDPTADADELHSLPIQVQGIHIGAYYPIVQRGIALLETIGPISTASATRQRLILLCGALLVIGMIAMLWTTGRRRHVHELSEEEKLWRVFTAIDTVRLDVRTALQNLEQVYLHLLHVQTGLGPDAFWAGESPAEADWQAETHRVRDIFRDNYQSASPDQNAVEQVKAVIADRLSSLVQERRLEIEQEPGFIDRLRRQPAILTGAGLMTVAAAICLLLVAQTDRWVSPEIITYNEAVAAREATDMPGQDVYLQFATLGDTASHRGVKFASLYNAGTLRARFAFGMATPALERLVLNTVIQTRSVEDLFHNLFEDGPFDEETQIVTTLMNGMEQYRRAQINLEEAVRTDPAVEDGRRNLEIILKRKQLVIDRLGEIRQFYREQNAGDEEEALSDQGIVNLLDSSLPDEAEEEDSKGKDDRGYMILERF